MAELDFEVTDEVDITDKVCPLTFVKAKVAIEELDSVCTVGYGLIALCTHLSRTLQ